MRITLKLGISITAICAAACGALIAWQADEKLGPRLQRVDDVNALRARADAGDAASQSKLASLYLRGEKIEQDYSEALVWYRKAADQGDANGQYGIGNIYYYGLGVPQDFAQTLLWYTKAANRGLASAEYGLGALYFTGRGVPRSDADAARWYRKAAEQSLPWAEYELAYMDYYGRGVPENRSEAYRLFRKAAEQGDVRAQRALGMTTRSLSPWRIAILSILAIGSLYLLMSVPSVDEFIHDRQQRAAGIAGLLGLAFAALDYLGAAHIGELHSVVAAMAFYFSMSFIVGAYCAFILIRYRPAIARMVLIASCLLLLISTVVDVPRYDLKGFAPPICAFSSSHGIFMGIVIPLVIWLWRWCPGLGSDEITTKPESPAR